MGNVIINQNNINIKSAAGKTTRDIKEKKTAHESMLKLDKLLKQDSLLYWLKK